MLRCCTSTSPRLLTPADGSGGAGSTAVSFGSAAPRCELSELVGLSFIRSIPLVLSVTGLVAIAGVVGLIAEPWRRRRPKATAPDAAAPQRPREHV